MRSLGSRCRQTLPPGTPIEVWFQDEMRVGQKNKLTYRWARTGSRPRAVHDQRTQSTYLFGAVCPERGAGSGLVLPVCNTEAMQLHLDDISTKIAPSAHAILIFDQAGWHGANCRHDHLNSTRKRTCGSSCAKTGSQIACSNPTTISLITAATPGTHSSISPGKLCPSPAATGPQ